MKIAYSWLQDYVPTQKTPEEIQELLTFHTAEVEDLEKAGQVADVVVGKVLEVGEHPNADKLRLAKVSVGEGKDLRIVCGAPNLEAGQLVPVAVEGAVLPGDFKIEKREVRGEMSEGMICAEDELGLGDKHEGIMVLDPGSYEIGEPFAPQGGDTVLDVSVPANRADLMSHVGIAREIAAVDKQEFKYQPTALPEINSEQLLKVEVDDKICPRYTALVISGIKIGPSPEWMQARLKSVGLRPINNIVDLTNYLMFDMGQPLHAFDFEKVEGAAMSVRASQEGENVQTLDDQTWKLAAGMPVISDSQKLIDLAGIMGGKNSEVSEATQTIVFQAATFAPLAVRKASRKLGHRTDAVGIYEKGVDPELALPTLAKGLQLLQQMIPGIQVRQVIDINKNQAAPTTIEFDPQLVEKMIGIKVDMKQIEDILQRLGMKISVDKVMVVEVPSWRSDITGPHDLVEEIVRIIGYQQIPAKLPVGQLKPPDVSEGLHWERKAKEVLVASGFNEVVNYAFNSQRDLEKMGITNFKGYLPVANPISPEHSYMRVSLVPNLLRNVKENLKNFPGFSIFELGRVFYGYDATKELKYKEAVHEEAKLTGVMVNTRPRKSKGKVTSRSFLEGKGVVEEILKKFGIESSRISYGQINVYNATFHPGRTAVIQVKVKGKAELEGEYNQEIGMIGEVHPAMLQAYGIKAVTVLFDIDFDELADLANDKKTIQTVGKYPGVTRDVAFILDRDVLVGGLKAVMGYAGGKLIEKVDLFDTYEGDQIPEGKKSLAFHVLYQLPDRTLTDKEVDEQHEKVIAAVKERYKAEIRK